MARMKLSECVDCHRVMDGVTDNECPYCGGVLEEEDRG